MQYPLLRTGLILDVNNLYFAVQAKFGQRRLQVLDYAKYLTDLGHTLTYKIIYSRQQPQEVPHFFDLLRDNGFETNFGYTHCGVPMALRAADIVANIDCLVIGSNFLDVGRILGWAKERGKLTKCFAAKIPPNFKQYAECIEIPPEILSDPANSTKPMELPTNVGSDSF